MVQSKIGKAKLHADLSGFTELLIYSYVRFFLIMYIYDEVVLIFVHMCIVYVHVSASMI